MVVIWWWFGGVVYLKDYRTNPFIFVQLCTELGCGNFISSRTISNLVATVTKALNSSVKISMSLSPLKYRKKIKK